MVRWMLPMLCVACAAGAPGTDAPPTCGEAECAPACAEADAKVVVPAGGDRLTAYEAERLTEARMALRRGLGPRGTWPVALQAAIASVASPTASITRMPCCSRIRRGVCPTALAKTPRGSSTIRSA